MFLIPFSSCISVFRGLGFGFSCMLFFLFGPFVCVPEDECWGYEF